MRIYLTGFMGSGKTHWGKIWARESGMLFFDLDQMIEDKYHQTVADIFETKGEEFFRKAEAEVLRETIAYNDCIVACGGGTPCFNDNLHWMNDHGYTVYLKAVPTKLMERVLQETDKRPLLKKIHSDELLLFIEKKLEEREDFYAGAQWQLEEEYISNSTINDIIARAKQ